MQPSCTGASSRCRPSRRGGGGVAEPLHRWQTERVWTSDGSPPAAHQLADDELSPDQHHDRLADSNLQLSPTLDDMCSLTSTLGPIDRHIAHNELHCQHPSGCDEPAEQCDVDHIVPVSAGGRTSQVEGRLECSTHNRDERFHDERFHDERFHDERFHDHGAEPFQERAIDRLDELLAIIRWRTRREDELIARRSATRRLSSGSVLRWRRR
jgi:hypothetical protein